MMETGCKVILKKRHFFGGKKRLTGHSVELAGTSMGRGKGYGSVKLKGKNRILTNQVSPWSSDEMDPKEAKQRKSETYEKDNFLELLSKVQDNRYNNQRYSVPTIAADDKMTDEVFEDSRQGGGIVANGMVTNGKAHFSKHGAEEIPTVEITDSPSTLHRRLQKASSIGSFSAVSEDSRSPDEGGRPSSAGSRAEREASFSPSQSLILSPNRKSTDALKKVISVDGPYPLLIESPDGGYWLQNGDYEVACGKDGVWRAPEISTEHYTIQSDKTAFVYGRYFKKQDHQNYVGRDSKLGPVIVSLKMEEDYQGSLARVLIRTQKETVYKIIPSSQLSAAKIEPEDYIKYAFLSQGAETDVDKAIPISSPKVTDLLQKFDEHPMARTHKFGVIYQQFGQTCEEELFGNVEYTDSLAEFLEMLGDKVELKGFEGYRGGLDVSNNQTGEHSVYTEFKDRKIMFHVSTLLPHDQGDTQYVQKKRHIGNDIVVIIFQDANTPFCPSMIRSHFVHAYIVVQVEHPNTDHTVYKVAVSAKDEVPDFGPPLPDPAIFQKGAEFRDWLLMKALNAEFNCHQASSFKKLATRTRNQLFLHLVEGVAQSIEDVDGISLTKELTASLDRSNGLSPDLSRHKKRRRTLTGMFGKKEISLFSASPTTSRGKSISSSPKGNRRNPMDYMSPVRHMLAGSTPDLVEETNGCLLSPDPCEQTIDSKKEKAYRKLTFKKKQEPGREKERRKAKRTASVNGPSGYSIANYRQQSTISPSNKLRQKAHDSSEESSIASGMGSIPFDLPGSIDADHSRRENSKFHYPDSSLTLEDVSISLGQPEMVDVGVQCSPMSSSTTCYNSPSHSNSTTTTGGPKGEHSNRLHSVNMLSIHTSPNRTQSLPTTPIKKRKSFNTSDIFNYSRGGTGDRATLGQAAALLQVEPNRQLYINKALSNGRSRDLHEPRRRQSADQILTEDKSFYRVESLESVSTEADEVNGSLLQSLETIHNDVARSREQNFSLIRENVKFASQNQDLKTKYLLMKDQLAAAQLQIKDLQQKLQLCQLQPSASSQD